MMLNSCSLKSQAPGASISLHFEFHNLLKKNPSTYLFNSILSAPSVTSSFDCLAVNVMGDGISSNAHKQTTDGKFCSYSGITSKPILFSENTIFDLKVPSGLARKIQVLGLVDASTGICKISQSIGDSKELSGTYDLAFELGSAVLDLFSNQKVSIQNEYDFLTPDEQKKRDVGCGQPTQKPGKLSFKVQPNDTTADTAINPVIEVLDLGGKPMTDSTSEITVSLSFLDLAEVPPAMITKIIADHGVADFTQAYFRTAGSYQLIVSADGLASATSQTFKVTPSAATKLGYLIQPAQTSAGVSFRDNVLVAIQDFYGNTVTSASNPITIIIDGSPSGVTLSGSATIGASSGVSTFSTLSINKVGTYKLLATSGGMISATSNSFPITSGSASTLVFKVQPTPTLTNTPISPPITVEAQDANGNTASNFTNPISISIKSNSGTAGAVLSGTISPNAVAGLATFSDLHIDKGGANYILVAASGSLTSAQSSTFNINEALPTITTVSPAIGSADGGTLVTITGTNFTANSILNVTFGGAACTSGTLLSPTSLTCLTPAHATGSVGVVVKNPVNQIGSISNAFTYMLALLFVDSNDATIGFSGGVKSGIVWDSANSYLKQTTAGTPGFFTSRVLNPGTGSLANWTELAWKPTDRYKKGLPDNKGYEYATGTGYSLGLLQSQMQQNALLIHFDDAGNGQVDPLDKTGNTTLSSTACGGGNCPSFDVSGVFGGAVNFSSNKFYQIAPSVLSLSGETHYTVSVWVKPPVASATGGIFGHGSSSSNVDYDFSLNAGKGTFGALTSPILSLQDPSAILTPLEWHHFAVVRSAGTFYLYKDCGSPSVSGSGGSSEFSGSANTLIGYTTSQNWFTGSIDELSVWKTDLSAANISSLCRRAAGDLKFQVQTCNNLDCSDGVWVGPNNDPTQYYSEAGNNLLSTPSLSLTGLSPAHYFRYQVTFTNDYSYLQFSPQLQSVTVTSLQ